MEYHKTVMKVALSRSLRELMTRNLFEKITIKKICDETGVIRATFYNYFDDKYDCLNWIVYHDVVESTRSYVEKGDFKGVISVVLKNVEENRAFYKAAYQVTGQNDFADIIVRRTVFPDMIMKFFPDILQKRLHSISEFSFWIQRNVLWKK